MTLEDPEGTNMLIILIVGIAVVLVLVGGVIWDHFFGGPPTMGL